MRLTDDVLDLNLGELLTMAVLLLVALAATLLEDDDLVALYEGYKYLSCDLCACDGGCADGYLTVVVNEENLVELNAVTLILLCEVVNKERSVLRYFELLTSNFNDCVHFTLYDVKNDA